MRFFISSKAGLINFYQDKKKNISVKDFAKHRGLKISDLKQNIFVVKKNFTTRN